MRVSPQFTRRERAVIAAHRTPLSVQRWLRSMEYNWEPNGDTLRTFRGVVKHETAHCLEAALAAATILEQHGDPPLLLSFDSQDGLDHVLFVFKRRGRWGSIGRSRDLGLHGRKPVYRSIRDLVWSYFDPYIDKSGRILGYAVADLREVERCDWRLSVRNVWRVEKHLLKIDHTSLPSSDRRYEAMRRRYLAFRQRNPTGHLQDYVGREHWLL